MKKKPPAPVHLHLGYYIYNSSESPLHQESQAQYSFILSFFHFCVLGNLKKYSFVKGFLSKGILEVGSRKVACFDSRKKKKVQT